MLEPLERNAKVEHSTEEEHTNVYATHCGPVATANRSALALLATAVTGLMTMADNTNIHQSLFTIEYTKEQDLPRDNVHESDYMNPTVFRRTLPPTLVVCLHRRVLLLCMISLTAECLIDVL